MNIQNNVVIFYYNSHVERGVVSVVCEREREIRPSRSLLHHRSQVTYMGGGGVEKHRVFWAEVPSTWFLRVLKPTQGSPPSPLTPLCHTNVSAYGRVVRYSQQRETESQRSNPLPAGPIFQEQDRVGNMTRSAPLPAVQPKPRVGP